MDRMDTSYDSTWEEDEEEDGKIVQARGTYTQNGKPKGLRYEYMFSSAARDMQNYRHGYERPGTKYQGDPGEMPNLSFYRNEIKFKPNGLYIDDLLTTWKEDYDALERNHNYIQWLFPLRERGLNPYATPLQLKEIEMMKNDSSVQRRLLEAYRLMLGFYGLQLKDVYTREVCRAENWKQRYENLNNKTHNNLRITRILKCLGELGFQHCQYPLVHFFLKETLCHGELKNTKRSVLDYFMFSVKDKKERQKLVIFALEHYTPQSLFIWGPVDLLRNYQTALNKHQADNCNLATKEREKKNKKDTYEEYERGQEEGWGNERTTSKKRTGQDGVKEHRKEPLRNHNDDMKQYNSKDEKTRNGQEGMTEQGSEEILHTKNYEDDTQEVREDNKPRNGQCGMKEHKKKEISERNNNDDDIKEYKREDQEDGKLKNGQYGMKEHQKDKISKRNNNEDDIKVYKREDCKPRNGQDGMMERWEEEMSQKKNHERDESKYKREERGNKKLRNGQDALKEHSEEEISLGKNTEHDRKKNKREAMEDNNLRNGPRGVKNHKKEEISKRNNNDDDSKEYRREDWEVDKSRNGQDGMTERWEEEMSQRKNNEGDESKYKMKERGNKKPTNGQDGLKEHSEETARKKNNEDSIKEYKWKVWSEENSQGGKKEPMKLKPPYNTQNQSENNGDDNKQCRRQNGEEDRNKLMEKNLQHGQKKNGDVEPSGNTRPHVIDYGGSKKNNMGDREEKTKAQNSCDVMQKYGKVDIPNDRCVTGHVVDAMPEDENIKWFCCFSKRKLK